MKTFLLLALFTTITFGQNNKDSIEVIAFDDPLYIRDQFYWMSKESDHTKVFDLIDSIAFYPEYKLANECARSYFFSDLPLKNNPDLGIKRFVILNKYFILNGTSMKFDTFNVTAYVYGKAIEGKFPDLKGRPIKHSASYNWYGYVVLSFSLQDGKWMFTEANM